MEFIIKIIKPSIKFPIPSPNIALKPVNLILVTVFKCFIFQLTIQPIGLIFDMPLDKEVQHIL